jgi:preprotein translocase subunit SecE
MKKKTKVILIVAIIMATIVVGLNIMVGGGFPF